jgi:hypothetical protein
MREVKKRVKEEWGRTVEQAKKEASEETWRLDTEDYLKYIAEQKEKQRLLRMARMRR